jgi:hypothetical protein
MKKSIRLIPVGVLLLLLGMSTSPAQEVVFTSGPAVTPYSGGNNGGFAWADVNGDGTLDVFIPPNNVLLNHITFFTPVASANLSRVSAVLDGVGGLLADINGDGVPDLWSTNNNAPQTGLFYDSSGVYVYPTGTGDLASASPTGSVFYGMAVADIDHSNYLSAAWARYAGATSYADGLVFPPNLGITLLKGGPSGFTAAGNGAAPGNVAIDTSKSFETWDVHFLDANNDGWQDLLMPSFRHGYRPFDIQVDSIGARKGCILYMNDGTGKFVVPNPAGVYAIDSIKLNGAGTLDSINYASVHPDTGIVVDDTVRHFNAIGSQWGDLNNDGNVDLILTGTESNNYDGLRRVTNIVVVYGKGDGTFTFAWNGTNVVNSGLPTSGSIRAWDIGDYNNDGIPDVYASTTFGTTRLFRGNGNGTYTEVTTQDYVATAGGGRAGGFVDYNNDGFLDIYNYTGRNSVLQKNGGNSNHWIGFNPVGIGHNKNAIGAVFTLYIQGGAIKQTRYIKGEGNAAGHGELRALFGIGINTSIDRVDVRWPDGTTATYSGLAVDRYWTVYEGSAIPSATTLVSPANNSVSVPVADTLKWTAATDALGYNVQVSMDPTFANKALMAVNETVAGTEYVYSLGPATKYYWRVAAVNGGFMSGYTPANNFTTVGSAAAEVPTVLAPVSGSTNQPALLTLTVGKTSDASRYQWQVSTLPSFLTYYTNDSTADTTYAGQFTGGQTFYLRVRGMNDLGASAFSAIDTFTIMTPPVRTTLLLPANNTINVIPDSVFFVWRLVSNAASYNLQVSTVNSTNIYTGITDTTYRLNGLANNTNYTWKVEAINAGGTSYYTGGFGFTTITAPPAATTLLLPAANATDVPRNPTFVWNSAINATKYRLQVATDNNFTSIVLDTIAFEDTTLTVKDPLGAQGDYFWQVFSGNIGGFGTTPSTPRLFSTGDSIIQAVAGANSERPKVFALLQNYPNPFNPTTNIAYELPTTAHVKITIYDVLGRVVATLADGIQTANRYRITWNASNVSTGVYFCRMEAQAADGSGNFNFVKKLLLMK